MNAPDWTLKNSKDKHVKLSDLTGKVVLLYFWGTNSLLSKKIMFEHVDGINKKYDRKDLIIISIGCGWSDETDEEQNEYIKKKGYDFVNVHDSKGKVFKDYLIKDLPFFVLIDRKGKIVVSGSKYSAIIKVKKHIQENCKPKKENK